MNFYVIHEKRNSNTYEMIKDVYLTEQEAKANCKPIGKSYHSALVNGEYKMIPEKYEYRIEMVELDNPTFDIYIERISKDGTRISGLTYDKANELYDRYIKTDWVQLQLPLKQFGTIGVTKLKTNEDDEYWDKRNAYWEEQERIEMENEFYSPSCPWNAPGMSIHDFI